MKDCGPAQGLAVDQLRWKGVNQLKWKAVDQPRWKAVNS
jgi:hypothetical protein